MIALTRLNGAQMSLNADLIERIEATPDTTITLVDRTRYIVREPVPYVIELIEDYRARVLARSKSVSERPHRPEPPQEPPPADAPSRPNLKVITSDETTHRRRGPASVKPFPPARTK